MKKYLFKSLIIAIIISCHSGDDISDFKDFLNKIPDFTIPYNFNHNNQYKILSNDRFTQDEKNAFHLNGRQVIGKICLNNGTYAILYSLPADWAIPILITYNEKGKKIDSLAIDAGYRDEEESYYFNKTAMFNKDFTIEIIDTAIRYKVDFNEIRIDSTATMKINISNYKVDNTGKILKQ